jgi:hypothetical protein
MTDQLLVPAVLTAPSHDLILCSTGFLTQLREVEAQVTALKITDAQSAQHAANLLTRLTGAGKALDKQRLELNAPYEAQIRATNASAKEPAAKIETLKSALKTASVNYDREQARLAREAEAARQAEIRRLEAIAETERKAAAEKARMIAEEADRLRVEAEKAGLPLVSQEEDDWGESEPAPEPPQPTEAEKALAAVKFAPVAAPAKVAGVKYKTTLVPHIEDVNKLPDIFVTKTAKIAAIRSTFCSGWVDGDGIPVVPGVRFEVQRTMESTGKSTF